MFNSVVAANRAAFAAFGVQQEDENGVTPADRIEPDEDLPEWHVSISEDHPGRLASATTSISRRRSRRTTCNSSPPRAATRTRFTWTTSSQSRRASAAVSPTGRSSQPHQRGLARLPGLTIYLSQDLEFHNPVRIGDRLTAECEIVEDLGDEQYRLTTRVLADDEVVIDGEAVVLIDDLPE